MLMITNQLQDLHHFVISSAFYGTETWANPIWQTELKVTKFSETWEKYRAKEERKKEREKGDQRGSLLEKLKLRETTSAKADENLTHFTLLLREWLVPPCAP